MGVDVEHRRNLPRESRRGRYCACSLGAFAEGGLRAWHVCRVGVTRRPRRRGICQASSKPSAAGFVRPFTTIGPSPRSKRSAMTRPPEVPPESFSHSGASTPAEHPRASLPPSIPRARPVERPPLEPTEQAPPRERQVNRLSFAVLITAIVVIVASGGVLGYGLLRRAPGSRVATVSPAPPSALSVHSAPPPLMP